MEQKNRVYIFDTTLRDGEQTAGCTMTIAEKLLFARQLERLGVDIIEAGFPFASPDDFSAVEQIAGKIDGPIICALARTHEQDIRSAGRALKHCTKRRIHTFIGSSDIHLAHKLRIDRRLAMKMTRTSVTLAREYANDVQFSPEDASRTGIGFLVEIIGAALEAGATTINIPDTTGYAQPSLFKELFYDLYRQIPSLSDVTLSVHCHNDLGNAVANSLVAVEAGARQVEGCIMGIGERAGNTALEPVIMALAIHEAFYGVVTGIRTEEIYPTARMLSDIIGRPISVTSPVIGENVFAHEAGIHADGVLKDSSTYEIMNPRSVGWIGESIIIGKHSGKAAIRSRLVRLGYEIDKPTLLRVYGAVIALADLKKNVYDSDLHMIMREDAIRQMVERHHLFSLAPNQIDYAPGTASVTIAHNDDTFTATGTGDGAIDAVFAAIVTAVSRQDKRFAGLRMNKWETIKGSGGSEATGFVVVELTLNDDVISARAGNPDVIKATAIATVYAVNQLIMLKKA